MEHAKNYKRSPMNKKGVVYLITTMIVGALIISQPSYANIEQDDIKREEQRLSIEKKNIEIQLQTVESHIRELEGRLINYLEQAQLHYDQWVRKNGISDVSESMLNDMNDRKEREELEIVQEKRRLANINEELNNIHKKLEELYKSGLYARIDWHNGIRPFLIWRRGCLFL